MVCHSPAWVKDIQINRQLSNITDLFRGLESLLTPVENSEPTALEPQTQSENSVLKHKKNFKIWFSPRSRKVRCQPLPDSMVENTTPALPETATTESQDLSVFNFSSSQDSDNPSPQRGQNKDKKDKKPLNGDRKPTACRKRPATRKQTKLTVKKQRLEAVNQQWGFGSEVEAKADGEQSSAGEGGQMSSKRVSFLSPAIEEPQQESPQGTAVVHRPSRSILKGGQPGEGVLISTDHDQPSQSPQTSPSALGPVTTESSKSRGRPGGQDPPCAPKIAPPRAGVEGEGSGASQSTPKRPRPSLGQGRRPVEPLVSPSTSMPERTARRVEEEQSHSPCSPAATKRSPSTPGGSGGRSSQSSPSVMKRNRKGETPLHLAAIKGEVEAVRELLEQGADPNLKDNAGWTPLHEACNHGYLGVAEMLVRGGALLNTPGYENDSPLHDAVRNGHVGIAKLLLEQGASQTVLNMYGLQPADYAGSPEMQAVFRAVSEGPQPTVTPLSPPPSLSKMSLVTPPDKRMVILASKLSRPQQNQLTRLGRVLGGKRVDSFSSSVTHVVVPDGPTPTTLTSLLGILSGCWVLRFSWVEACLQAGSWTPEADHEAGEGPQRSRINKDSLLPPLFDGCFFFFLGSFKKPPRQELLQMVREGGGQVLSRQPKPDSDVTQTLSAAAYHATPGSDQALCTQYVIYDPQGSYRPPRLRLGKVWSASSSWIVSCICAFQLLPVTEA